MKTSSGFLSVFLILSLILSLSACATQTGSDTGEQQSIQVDSSTELFLSLTEKTSKSLIFPLTEDQAAKVKKAGAKQVTWTLHRTAPYANPVDGKFIPLHNEEKCSQTRRKRLILQPFNSVICMKMISPSP